MQRNDGMERKPFLDIPYRSDAGKCVVIQTDAYQYSQHFLQYSCMSQDQQYLRVQCNPLKDE